MGMRLQASWNRRLSSELCKPYVARLKEFLEREKQEGKIVFPEESLVFNAFRWTPFEQVKVVIIGQDPYHGPHQAHGLSFSVPKGVDIPPSLRNIYLELESDLGIRPAGSGCLEKWAMQGVFLLNATLTVRKGEPKSHFGRGWEEFTDAVIAQLAEREDPLIFVLWGKSAQQKLGHVLNRGQGRHCILTAAHPSPFSAHSGFFGCRHFSKINAQLEKWGKQTIDWKL